MLKDKVFIKITNKDIYEKIERLEEMAKQTIIENTKVHDEILERVNHNCARDEIEHSKMKANITLIKTMCMGIGAMVGTLALWLWQHVSK